MLTIMTIAIRIIALIVTKKDDTHNSNGNRIGQEFAKEDHYDHDCGYDCDIDNDYDAVQFDSDNSLRLWGHGDNTNVNVDTTALFRSY